VTPAVKKRKPAMGSYGMGYLITFLFVAHHETFRRRPSPKLIISYGS
jgi:hypothetical protein